MMSDSGFISIERGGRQEFGAEKDLSYGAEPSSSDWSDYFLEAERTSILICADRDRPGASAAHLSRLAGALGHRVLDSVPVGLGTQRVASLVDVDAAVVACSGKEPEIEALLARLDMMASTQGTGLIVIVDLAGLDRVHALVQSHHSVILCEPSPEDVVVALAALTWRPRDRERLCDIGREAESDRIERLSDQLVRLNRTIEALVQNRAPEGLQSGSGDLSARSLYSPSIGYSAHEGDDGEGSIPVTAHQVRAILRVRRLREHAIAADLFADPAWDILLDLMAARLEHSRVSVSSLCIAAAVPPTTALRWIRQLTERGLLERQADPKDGRRIFIALSDEGATKVLRWFRESRSHLLTALGSIDGRRAAGNLPC